jgi:hypothetical protein
MGTFYGNAPTLTNTQNVVEQVDSTGSAYANNEGRKASYRAVSVGVVATANGVLLSVQGSATKVIRVTRVYCNGILTTAGSVTIGINRCTGAVSSASGTVAVTPRLLDTGNAAASALVNTYTTSTIGAGATLLANARAFYAPATALATGYEFTFGTRNTQALVLRGTTDFMQISYASSGYTGALFDCDVEFTEE